MFDNLRARDLFKESNEGGGSINVSVYSQDCYDFIFNVFKKDYGNISSMNIIIDMYFMYLMVVTRKI